jgi:hypothetical protein
MAIEGVINSKNPKTLSLRKLLDEEREKVTLHYVPGHMGIPGNVIARKKQKVPQKNTHHKIWITGSKQKTRKARWKNSENNMKNRKKEIKRNKDEKTRPVIAT